MNKLQRILLGTFFIEWPEDISFEGVLEMYVDQEDLLYSERAVDTSEVYQDWDYEYLANHIRDLHKNIEPLTKISI